MIPISPRASKALTIAKDDHMYLAPLFLGPAGENEPMMERTLLAFVRDHIHWRRNFHPEDPPAITAFEQYQPEFGAAVARTEQALRQLSARLKKSVPMFSPRYVGHMSSDLLLPGLLAQLITTLYNPNNVTAEVAPVTVDLEIEVGQQLARMFGFNTDLSIGAAAYGHLTSGGTVANYEALWLQRAIRFYPIAVVDALRGEKEFMAVPALRMLGEEFDAWRLANLSSSQIFDLRDNIEATLARSSNASELRQRITTACVEHAGMAAFLSRHHLATPVVICPRTAHYSWPKAMQLLGLGDAQLWYADVDSHMRLDAKSVAHLLDLAWREQVPVLAVIGVLGTTEFGTIDPVHELIALRSRMAQRGQTFAIHIDAAWGGYLATLFRNPDGSTVPRAQLRAKFPHFPSPSVYRAFVSLNQVDSVTVDPHKLGYLPFGAGAFVGRDRRMTEFVGQRPVYLYDEANRALSSDRISQLGDYILEGSKAGAAAAAVFVTHQVLPLNADHFGRVCAQTMHASEYLFERLQQSASLLSKSCSIVLPIEPDTNLCCITVNPTNNRSLARMNRFCRALFAHLSIDPAHSPHTREFVGSHTSLLRKNLSAVAARALARKLSIDPDSFVTKVHDPEIEADHVFLLRHTLMNPWLTYVTEGRNFIDRYCEFLERAILATLVAMP